MWRRRMPEAIGYTGPSRDPDSAIRAALSDPEFVLQIISSYEEQLRGVPPVPLRQIETELQEKGPRRRRTA